MVSREKFGKAWPLAVSSTELEHLLLLLLGRISNCIMLVYTFAEKYEVNRSTNLISIFFRNSGCTVYIPRSQILPLILQVTVYMNTQTLRREKEDNYKQHNTTQHKT